MYQHWIVALALASAPLAAAVPQTPPATKKPAPTTQKPASETKAGSKGVRTVEIVGTDDMKFSLNAIPAKRGEQLRIRLVSKGTMPKVAMAHNFVLLQKGASQVKFVTAGATARATDFIPPAMKGQVIAQTTLAGPGETVEVTFKVPNVAGAYPFLCTFPGHFQAGMRGMLNVK
ncbi:MAG: plastocyanin/azurin family copper-binding protein [Vicinamibacterales bacterium]